jgi:hypothetical protein
MVINLDNPIVRVLACPKPGERTTRLAGDQIHHSTCRRLMR